MNPNFKSYQIDNLQVVLVFKKEGRRRKYESPFQFDQIIREENNNPLREFGSILFALAANIRKQQFFGI